MFRHIKTSVVRNHVPSIVLILSSYSSWISSLSVSISYLLSHLFPYSSWFGSTVGSVPHFHQWLLRECLSASMMWPDVISHLKSALSSCQWVHTMFRVNPSYWKVPSLCSQKNVSPKDRARGAKRIFLNEVVEEDGVPSVKKALSVRFLFCIFTVHSITNMIGIYTMSLPHTLSLRFIKPVRVHCRQLFFFQSLSLSVLTIPDIAVSHDFLLELSIKLPPSIIRADLFPSLVVRLSWIPNIQLLKTFFAV